MTRVLIVEDDPWIAWMVADDLVDRGYVVVRARDAAEAFRQLEDGPSPDVIVLDVMMPGINGWDFLERYQQNTRGCRLPIIVVSEAAERTRSMEGSGVRAFLRKPLDVEELARCIAAGAASAAVPAVPA